MMDRAYVSEKYRERYTEQGDPKDFVGHRVRVLDGALNPRDELGAWFVTGLDPKNTAHVLVAKVDDFRVETWSIHHGHLRMAR